MKTKSRTRSIDNETGFFDCWALNGYCWIWNLIILIAVVIVLIMTISALVTLVRIRGNTLPHCYTIFGTGPDVVPGQGEADPFFPELGPMVKGEIEVGSNCIDWSIRCFNLTSVPTEMAIHGMVFGTGDN